MRASLIVALMCLPSVAVAAEDSEQPPELNRKIVRFCKNNLGKKVGNGDCYFFANHAINTSGGSRPLRNHPGAADYVWGKLVYYREQTKSETKTTGKTRSILPGDIVQFRNARFSGKNWSYSFAHHSAVIVHTANNGDRMRVFHQNYNGKKHVTELTLHAHTLKKGWFRVYRPQLTPNRKK